MWAGLVVLLGIALNIYSKNFDKVNKWLNILFLRKTSSTDEVAYLSRFILNFTENVASYIYIKKPPTVAKLSLAIVE